MKEGVGDIYCVMGANGEVGVKRVYFFVETVPVQLTRGAASGTCAERVRKLVMANLLNIVANHHLDIKK